MYWLHPQGQSRLKILLDQLKNFIGLLLGIDLCADCQSGTWTAIGGGSDIATKGINGQTILPSGLIIKWGFVTSVPTLSTKTVIFPSPFPNNVLTAQVSSLDTNGYGMVIYSASKTQIVVNNRNNVIQDAYWMAIGY